MSLFGCKHRWRHRGDDERVCAWCTQIQYCVMRERPVNFRDSNTEFYRRRALWVNADEDYTGQESQRQD